MYIWVKIRNVINSEIQSYIGFKLSNDEKELEVIRYPSQSEGLYNGIMINNLRYDVKYFKIEKLELNERFPDKIDKDECASLLNFFYDFTLGVVMQNLNRIVKQSRFLNISGEGYFLYIVRFERGYKVYLTFGDFVNITIESIGNGQYYLLNFDFLNGDIYMQVLDGAFIPEKVRYFNSFVRFLF